MTKIMPEIPNTSPEIELYIQKIISLTSDSTCKKIFEILERWKNWKNWTTIWASEMLDIASNTTQWVLLNDIQVISKFFEYYEKLTPSEKNEYCYHLNLNPKTLLDEKYWNILTTILDSESNNWSDKLININLEIIEVDEFMYDQNSIKKLNSKIQILKEWYWVKVWIDDFPSMSNWVFTINNIKWIDFVKFDKSIIEKYINSKKTQDDKDELEAILRVSINAIKRYHWDIDIIVEWVENKKMYEYLKKEFPWISHFQWFYFWKPKELKIPQ